VYLRKEKASSEMLCILLVGAMEEVLKEVCEVSNALLLLKLLELLIITTVH
jgi:hypothetical protein